MAPGGEHSVECDKRVNLSNMEGGGLEEHFQRELIHQQLEELLATGRIEESQSP